MHPSIALISLLVGCATVHPPPAAPVPIREADVRERARALLAAYDRGDEADFLQRIEENFAFFGEKRLHFRNELLSQMRERRERGAPPVVRDYEEEHIRVSPSAAVYLGHSIEHLAAEPDRPARDYEGYDTLVFARGADDALRAVHWAWERAGVAGERERWNETYLHGASVVTTPNQTLVDAVQGIAPGAALDLGVGQGRNAIFLAARGWKVTGVDIADVGLGLAREEAARRKLDLTLVQADLDAWDFGTARWDLVTMIYMGSDEAMVRRAQASLKPGGLFVLSGYAPQAGAEGPDSAAGGQLRSYFGDEFEVLRHEQVEGIADWAKQRTQLIHFVARRR